MKILLMTSLLLTGVVFALTGCNIGNEVTLEEKDQEVQRLQQEVSSLRDRLETESKGVNLESIEQTDKDAAYNKLEAESNEGVLLFNSKFIVNGFEIKIGSEDEIMWLTDRDSEDFISIPVTLKKHRG